MSNLDGSPKTVANLPFATAIAVGRYHQCAILFDRTVECWGNNHLGQLGDGTTEDSELPVKAVGIDDAIAIDSKYFHTCVVESDRRAKCWGVNSSGQLGDGTTENSNVPVVVGTSVADRFTDITTGSFHTCGVNVSEVTALGQISCWGGNLFGQLGNNTTRMSTRPIKLGGVLVDVRTASAGFYHTCASRSGNSNPVLCWGYNLQGQLGNGTNVNSHRPINVRNLDLTTFQRVIKVFMGGFHSCAVIGEPSSRLRDVKCWGDNEFGQLGNDTFDDSNLPVDVKSLTHSAAASAGINHNCILDDTSNVKCWGHNLYRQLFPSEDQSVPVPVIIGGLDFPP